MAKIWRLTIEIERVDNPDYDLTETEAQELLETMENHAAALGYSIYDQRLEEDEV